MSCSPQTLLVTFGCVAGMPSIGYTAAIGGGVWSRSHSNLKVKLLGEELASPGQTG